MNIDNLMDELVKSGISFNEVSKAFDDAVDRKSKKDNEEAIGKERLNVLQALRKYCMALYGSVDEKIMAEFASTLKELEKIGKPTTFKMEMSKGASDDERIRRWIDSMKKF